MCTVTFIPIGNKYILTSNRDESVLRKPALPPIIHVFQNVSILYPVDGEAGGSWIGVNNNGHAGVLLNGAIDNHKHQPPYRKSRGIIFLKIMDSLNVVQTFNELYLEAIEPFTVILLYNENLFDCRWDGKQKHIQKLPADLPYTWSSFTLYNASMRSRKSIQFKNWVASNPQPAQEQIIQFHSTTKTSALDPGMLLPGLSQVQTISITSILLESLQASMLYIDRVKGVSFHSKLLFKGEKVFP